MQFTTENPVIRFYTLPRIANAPARADRSGRGSMPTRAYRYCDVVTTAAGMGWYAYPPMPFSLYFGGERVGYRLDGLMGDYAALPATGITYPDLTERFDQHAPDGCQGFEPPFLTALQEPGLVQIWTGLLVRTAPGWSIWNKRPANTPTAPGFTQWEGVVETDRYFGPLFTNLQLTAGQEVAFDPSVPLIQVVPIPQAIYSDAVQQPSAPITTIAAWSADDWASYDETVVAPNRDPNRQVGRYAVDARKRRRVSCPFAHTAA